MNRKELEQYIDNSILLGNIVTEKDEIYKRIGCGYRSQRYKQILGSVSINNEIYVKKDSENKIHLVCYAGDYEELDLGDCIDVIDFCAFYRFGHNQIWKQPLLSISGKAVESIGDFAFSEVPIKYANFPNVKEIGEGCFGLTDLHEVEFNNLNEIPPLAFKYTPMKRFRGDKVVVSEIDAFTGCKQLEKLILPRLCEEAVNELYKYSH